MAPRQMNSYGSVNVDDETTPLEVQNDGIDGSSTSLTTNKTFGSRASSWWKGNKTSVKTVIGGCAVVAILVLVSLGLVHQIAGRDANGDGSSGSSSASQPATRSSGDPTAADSGGTPPLSLLSPEHDLGLWGVDRAEDASPSEIWGGKLDGRPLPTNSWYLNLLSHRATNPDDSTRVYTIPYIIDTDPADAITAGLRVHWPVKVANARNIQMVNDFKNGISLGTSDTDVKSAYRVDDAEDLSLLGVSLKWSGDSNKNKKKEKGMVANLVRGMPYATVQYLGGVMPSLYSYHGPASPPLIDGKTELQCGSMDSNGNNNKKAGGAKVGRAEKEIRLHFRNSDFTWIVFFSRPVQVRCDISGTNIDLEEFRLSVVGYDTDDGAEEEEDEPLTVRLALIDQCTTGQSDIKQHCQEKAEWKDQDDYVQLLTESAHVLPSSPKLDFVYPDDDASDAEDREAQMVIDWGAQVATTTEDDSETDKLLMFALPHHQDTLASSSDGDGDGVDMTTQCIPTFHGSTCLVRGNKWVISEELDKPLSFTAPRPPEPDFIPALADAISTDIHYQLSSNMLRAASDTYFSGKILARLGRVIAIASELRKLASGVSSPEEVQALYDDADEESLTLSIEAVNSVDLPSEDDIAAAVEHLKKGVEVWLGEEAEAPYVYDRSWGGLVNCGCDYVGKGDKGVCKNKFPTCPALEDVNEDFGNGYYNDHHYHYGYHIYAAAVVAKFDPSWGKEYFDKVLLYIRDFANPSPGDKYFTQFRQKDWFLGSSWASGIVSAENSPHGRNEESSSEAIAAYEAVALYGAAMVDAFGDDQSGGNEVEAAKLVRDVGQLLTASEVRATNRFWHVWSSDTHVNTYPSGYKQPVVGMLYDTMASFQTWFAPEAVVSYGIQLMPFTPVAEIRDDPEWATELYPLYEESCETAGDYCVDNGWSIMQAGLLATTGKREEALEQALSIPSKVFDSLGGVGNSLTNTIWYISTRKPVSASTSSAKEMH